MRSCRLLRDRARSSSGRPVGFQSAQHGFVSRTRLRYFLPLRARKPALCALGADVLHMDEREGSIPSAATTRCTRIVRGMSRLATTSFLHGDTAEFDSLIPYHQPLAGWATAVDLCDRTQPGWRNGKRSELRPRGLEAWEFDSPSRHFISTTRAWLASRDWRPYVAPRSTCTCSPPNQLGHSRSTPNHWRLRASRRSSWALGVQCRSAPVARPSGCAGGPAEMPDSLALGVAWLASRDWRGGNNNRV